MCFLLRGYGAIRTTKSVINRNNKLINGHAERKSAATLCLPIC